MVGNCLLSLDLGGCACELHLLMAVVDEGDSILQHMWKRNENSTYCWLEEGMSKNGPCLYCFISGRIMLLNKLSE